VALVRAVTVEDEDAACALARDPACKQIAQFLGRVEAAGVQEVEPVEQIEGRLSNVAGVEARRGAKLRRG
jgi:hypothetical protein